GVPVKYMLSREEESLCTGNRPGTIQTYRLGARRDGTLTAIELTTVGNVGATGSWFSPVSLAAKELYRCENVRTVHHAIRTKLGTQAAFRAPGVVEGMAGLEVAMDRLAGALGIDPLELRLRNDTDRYQLLDRPYARKLLERAYKLGAERIGWVTRDTEERRF